MGAIRVTQQLLIDRVLFNLSASERRILRLQEQLSTGLRVNRPSDDPLAARRAVNLNTGIAQNDQFLTNITSAQPHLVESESAILSVLDMVQRAYELTLQGANGTNAQTQRDQIAIEINQLLDGMLVQSNQITNGRYIFGGTRTLNQPFTVVRNAQDEIISPVVYEGNDERIEIEASVGVRLPVNVTGREVFTQTSANSVDMFQMLIDIRDNLRAGNVNQLQTRLEELDLAQDQLLVAATRLGAVQNRFTRIESDIRDITVQFQGLLSDNIDADLAEVIVNLNAQSNAFQASLAAAARVIQPSLLDFVQ